MTISTMKIKMDDIYGENKCFWYEMHHQLQFGVIQLLILLPESFKASLLTHNGKELRCSTKPRINRTYETGSAFYSRVSTSSKRNSTSGLTPAKRFKRGGSNTKFFRGKNRKRN